MKIIRKSNYHLHLLTPDIGKIWYESFVDTRHGWKASFPTKLKYLRKNDKMGDWLEARLFGFGLALHWGFPYDGTR